MQRVVITGVTGHLGRALARQLVAAGVETHGLTRQIQASDAEIEKSVHYHELDGSSERVSSIFRTVRPDTVLHAAGVARREHQVSDINPFVEANILLGVQILEAMRVSDCTRIVTAGSYLQHYGSNGYRAFNLYAATKQAFEPVLDYYLDIHGLRGMRLTLSDVYSEYDTRPKLMTHIAACWENGTPVTLQAEEAWVDLLHVEDAAAAFGQAAALLETDSHANNALHRYAVTSGRGTSATALVSLFEELGGKRVILERGKGKSPSVEMIGRGGPILPGWEPKIGLEEGIARIIGHMRQRYEH